MISRRLLLVFALSVLTGCGGNARYVPATTTAREAVETALKTWQSGTAHGPIKSSGAEIHVHDARWQAGKKLDSFEIVEELAGQEHPQFKVKMKLAGQPEDTATYLVVGINPLNVFRDADLQKGM